MRSLGVIFSALWLLHSLAEAVSVTGEEGEGCGCSVKSAPREANRALSSTWQQITAETSSASSDKEGYATRKMVKINGGVGSMGTDDPKIPREGEGPRRQIELSPFLIDKYEVSNNGECNPTCRAIYYANFLFVHVCIPYRLPGFCGGDRLHNGI